MDRVSVLTILSSSRRCCCRGPAAAAAAAAAAPWEAARRRLVPGSPRLVAGTLAAPAVGTPAAPVAGKLQNSQARAQTSETQRSSSIHKKEAIFSSA
ncbi:hypothetical protein EJB05_39297 [Eragrostis curvula]|uniref:Uncharacterized protein n=1 Tax=Eragrostis curvula TaxID=38414 RepID=A0A5J9TWK1_9POAL|nr:hypothetical protein EJB05_39297 [Eragrostis curvula]